MKHCNHTKYTKISITSQKLFRMIIFSIVMCITQKNYKSWVFYPFKVFIGRFNPALSGKLFLVS